MQKDIPELTLQKAGHFPRNNLKNFDAKDLSVYCCPAIRSRYFPQCQVTPFRVEAEPYVYFSPSGPDVFSSLSP